MSLSRDPGVAEVREVAERDLGRALELDEEYVGVGAAKFDAWRRQRPGWLRGAYLGDELVGICFGNEKQSGAVVLQTIGVMVEHWRTGIGTQLLEDFERTVVADGMVEISLGSAPDVPTESFYRKNGYRATNVMLRVSVDLEMPTVSSHRPEEVREDEHGRTLVFRVERYDRAFRDELSAEYDAHDAIFIFEKDLTREKDDSTQESFVV